MPRSCPVFHAWRQWLDLLTPQSSRPAPSRPRPSPPTLPAAASLLPGAAFPAGAARPTLVLTGDEGGAPTDDTILLHPDAADPGAIEIVLNGQLRYSGPRDTLPDLAIDGGAGSDTVI